LLLELSISNLAIIERLRLEFGSGFNVLTGETGTGKSIIIDAVNLLLGGRASADLIRTGCEEATVEGVFALAPAVLGALAGPLRDLGLLEEAGVEAAEAGELILRREISRSGRSICRVNGRAVPVAALRELTHHLIDIHGQGEHLSLMQVRRHIDYLDRFENLYAQRQAFAAMVQEVRHLRQEMAALRQDERELARRIDLLTFQVEEIRSARLRPGEEEELRNERLLLANAEKLTRLAADTYDALSGGEEGQRAASDLLATVVDNLGALARLDPSLADQRQLAESTLYQLEDLARTMRAYRDGVEYNPERLQEIEDRLEILHALKRKYGDSLEEVVAFAQRAQSELDRITHSEERIDELQAQEQAVLDKMAVAAQALHLARELAATHLGQRIEEELAALSMEQARFLIDIRWHEATDGVIIGDRRYAFDATGLDRVEFLIAPNPGEEPKPLVKIASGGETSRLMLAMKTALSAIDPVPTLIFDEIDSGIGGRTGSVVGQKLWTLALGHQVFCVTHLAQMACYGERHFHVTKEVVGGRTVSVARLLSPAERIEELAVMLSGGSTEATRRSAEELLRRVADLRSQIPQ
jgi:DNA repair protein RecN (Recombination protein N)